MSLLMRFPFLLKIYLKFRPPHEGTEGPVTPKEALARYEAKRAILLDVREASEIAAGMAAGALWVPTSDIKANGPKYRQFLDGLDKKKEVIVYCAAGVRAGHVVQDLTKRGFKASNVGGFKDWVQAGLPVARPNA